MSLLRPGGGRAGDLMSDAALLEAMVRVEQSWLDARGVPGDLAGLAGEADLPALDAAGEQAGNPVVPLVALLRERLRARGDAGPAERLHRGLTSQDVLDTAVVLSARDSARAVSTDVRRQVTRLRELAAVHVDNVRAARTLTQIAVPTTFGLVAATWLTGVLDAAEDLDRAAASLPVQVGGAAGTLAGPATQGDAATLVRAVADALGLPATAPWHTNRAPITRLGDALVGLHDAWGRIANDVLVGSRPEIGELSEGTGGGSSTMPHKHNPVLAVLVRSSALRAPELGATLHTAAAAGVDQRPDGGWHAEWPALRDLVRDTIVASAQTADLLDGLQVDTERMAANVATYADDLLAEARDLDAGATDPAAYLGTHRAIVTQVTDRADAYLRES